jgi:hypothetical protein
MMKSYNTILRAHSVLTRNTAITTLIRKRTFASVERPSRSYDADYSNVMREKKIFVPKEPPNKSFPYYFNLIKETVIKQRIIIYKLPKRIGKIVIPYTFSNIAGHGSFLLLAIRLFHRWAVLLYLYLFICVVIFLYLYLFGCRLRFTCRG